MNETIIISAMFVVAAVCISALVFAYKVFIYKTNSDETAKKFETPKTADTGRPIFPPNRLLEEAADNFENEDEGKCSHPQANIVLVENDTVTVDCQVCGERLKLPIAQAQQYLREDHETPPPPTSPSPHAAH